MSARQQLLAWQMKVDDPIGQHRSVPPHAMPQLLQLVTVPRVVSQSGAPPQLSQPEPHMHE